MITLLRRTLRLIALTLLVGGLAMPSPPQAHASVPCGQAAPIQAGFVQTAFAGHHAAMADSSSHPKKPGDASHTVDCCIAGTCASNAMVAPVSAALRPRPAGSFIYLLRAVIEPPGIEAIPSTHPPKAII